jgi:hypothetical protein
MTATKLTCTLAIASMVASAALGQAVPTTSLQQPEAFGQTGAVAAVPTPGILQPGQTAAAPAVAPLSDLLQPDPFFAPPKYASYYDETLGDETSDAVAEAHDGSDSDYGDECCDDGCGWDCGGWIQQGITFNGYDPQDGFNGPVVMNDQANEYQMNQLWLYTERLVDNGGCGWDYGGRVDVVYGTDARFMVMEDGLEENWGQDGFYQLALLRFYGDIAYDDWTLRAGRWDVPVGYEPYEGTESFFYSRSYNFLAQPGTMLAMMLTRHLNDQLSVSAGMHRGTDQFDDTDGKNALDFVGGGSWESCDGETWLDAYVIAEEKGIGNDTLHYSVYGGTMLSERLEYVCEWYYGHTDDVLGQGEWYGLNNHLMREINDCWSYGTRFEWFRDDDGFRIFGVGTGNAAEGPFVGDFFEVTFAVNYTPTENFALRPEVRWDWYDADFGGGPQPFDDGTRSNQFIASLDAIWTF